jgi:hypothetical protein
MRWDKLSPDGVIAIEESYDVSANVFSPVDQRKTAGAGIRMKNRLRTGIHRGSYPEWPVIAKDLVATEEIQRNTARHGAGSVRAHMRVRVQCVDDQQVSLVRHGRAP